MTLSSFIPEWEELAAAALEPNVFYEHWMLLPALEAFGAGRDICFALVMVRDPANPDAPARLGGLFPLELVPRVSRLQRPALSLWQYLHCCLCTPLVRSDAVSECLVELFLWLRSGEATAPLLELKWIPGDGPFHRALMGFFRDLNVMSWMTGIFTRGLLLKEPGALETRVSMELIRAVRRKEKLLSERGRVEHVALGPRGDVARWIGEFLRIEERDWRAGRADAPECPESYRRYFTETATTAYERGRLVMLGIDLDARPIARSCALISGEGAYAFRAAIDGEFARYSPGAMLELDHVRALHVLPGVRWLDSCTARQGAVINRLSSDRRTIQSLAVGVGTLGELVLSGMPLLRWSR